MGAASDMRGYGGASAGAIILAVMPGGALAFLGFLGLVFCQIGRANVDTAEYTQQGLKISREQLEISRQALKQGASMGQGYAALQVAKEELRATMKSDSVSESASYAEKETTEKVDSPSEPNQPPTAAVETHRYKGCLITFDGQHFHFGKMKFINLDVARSYVDLSVANADDSNMTRS
ncbi:hypothetical protein SAMN04488026_11851 [Aliiruegeria lutimaris]|uniref:Uncharacterized protein n=2 Tax=Aliiruegeria lutimaris TaxID=571298 RepID=A0A1G9QQK6_9RHOB|nr:hypothetical protein SAMN04488026_11851 [Aliiruegeria lutimaris]